MYQKGTIVNVRYKSEYYAWRNAKSRCFNPNHPQYKWYGARGIKVYSGWIKGFMDFLKDVGEKPDPKLTLDRIDNDKDYEPGNCRWVTMKVQCNNRRKRTKWGKGWGGRSPKLIMGKTIKEWSKIFGYKPNSLYRYKYRYGLNYEEAINELIIKKGIRKYDRHK